SGGGGLYLSTNGGQSWSPVPIDSSIVFASSVAVDSTNGSFVGVAVRRNDSRGAVWVSSDGGQTWSPAGAGVAGYPSNGIACDRSESSIVYAISSANVFRTNDSGSTWTLQGSSSHAFSSFAESPADSQTLYGGWVGGGAAGVDKSVDGGASWTPTGSGLT